MVFFHDLSNLISVVSSFLHFIVKRYCLEWSLSVAIRECDIPAWVSGDLFVFTILHFIDFGSLAP
jgi:hypothetical protein